jgi:hypothetical protein
MTNPPAPRDTVLLDPIVRASLAEEAKELGLELADHLSSILTAHAMPRVQAKAPDLGKRLVAEAGIKTKTAQISRRLAGEPGRVHLSHTLKVFQELRLKHSNEYLIACGCKTGLEAGSVAKHRLNLALGAISKRAAEAKVRKDAKGNPEKIRNIRGEFCTSVTMLEPGDSDSGEIPMNETPIAA